MSKLYKQSIEVIRANQPPSGAYLASPNVLDYRYSWFRDGSFIAFAMDLVEDHESAFLFHNWAAETICAYKNVVERAININNTGSNLSSEDILHARYTVNGQVGPEWPNFQLDGLGTWLWALGEHLRLTNIDTIPTLWAYAIEFVTKYLCHLWSLPNYDCWEENEIKFILTLSGLFMLD